MAAEAAEYSTRPVQLFYSLSQASRALVAASPRITNNEWNVRGHGLSAVTGNRAADTKVKASDRGLFQAVATAIGAEPLVAAESHPLEELWPVLPYSAFMPLTARPRHPTMYLQPTGGHAGTLGWVSPYVNEECGNDRHKLLTYLQRYPTLKDAALQGADEDQVLWPSDGPPGYRLFVKFPNESWTITDEELGRKVGLELWDNFFVVTPSIGGMTSAFHPFLAWWAVLLALSSLARYEPAVWAQIIDIDHSPEANAIEECLDRATTEMPALVLRALRLLARPNSPTPAGN